uniref:Uncharacterized protein n=1 Tax=Cyclophora tenuis TaxID=216820 RepID=A0A7S1CYG8_CYCTE
MRLPTLGGGSSSPMIGQTLGNPGWRREIATDQSVEVAALELVNPSTLILAGTAKGSDTQAIPADGITRNTDYDGFVTMLDPADGLILGTLRVQSELGKQDRVEAMCFQEGTVTNPEYIYLVGSTTGIMDAAIDERDQETYSAFIMQVSVPNLEVVSTAQLIAQFGPLSSNPSGPQMRGLACAVTSDGADVYVGGVVEEGSVVVADGQTTSSGRDDVFVAQFSTRTSDWEFVQQFGSNRDDSLVDIAVDKYDNAVVLGNTMGSLMREKTSPETTSDVFVVSVARNTGEYEASAGGGFARHGSTHPPGVVATIPPDVRSPSPAPATGDGGGRLNGGLVAVLVVMSVCGTLIACFYCRRSMTQDIYTDRDQVLEYLKGFDDVEVDLKHSATGGWHGTYINHDGAPRYFSDNHMPDTITFSGSEMSPLTHNEIVQDSLFTDDYEEPQLGGARGGVGSSGAVMQDDDVVLERPPSTYGGLVDAYNTTWDDMNPYALPGSKRNSAASHRASVSSSGGTPRQSFQGLRDVNINEDEPWGNEII